MIPTYPTPKAERKVLRDDTRRRAERCDDGDVDDAGKTVYDEVPVWILAPFVRNVARKAGCCVLLVTDDSEETMIVQVRVQRIEDNATMSGRRCL